MVSLCIIEVRVWGMPATVPACVPSHLAATRWDTFPLGSATKYRSSRFSLLYRFNILYETPSIDEPSCVPAISSLLIDIRPQQSTADIC